MKKLFLLMLALLSCVMLAVPVSAQSEAGQVRTETTVDADGSCRVVITATVTYDDAVSSPVFPIPSGAENVVLNGSPATVYTAASSRMVSLKDVTRGNAGTFSFSISYYLPAVVASAQDGLTLELQLLSGFPYPIADLQVVVSLPAEVSGQPVFISGYYQQSVDDLLDVSVNGSTITVTSVEALKDHETLTMDLAVDAKMFPQTARTARVLSVMDIVITLSMILAAAYYLITMRPTIPRRNSRPTAPDGITAGDAALWLAGGSMDLSMLVVTWAQLGYVRIQVDDSGRVLLHKRMDMGNERSAFENRCYKNLFGRRRMVDGTGYHYAQLCRSVKKRSPQVKEVYQSKSGSPLIFRGLCALSAVLSGFSMAGAVAAYSTWLMVLLAASTALMAVLIQSGGRCLPLRDKLPLWIGLGCAVVWMGLGIWSGEWLTAMLEIGSQFLAGIAVCYGGKRTELGQQALTQIMGLRRFMARVSKRELQQLLKANPSYFHELAPYALALGMDKIFAHHFGRLRLPECTYLICGNHRQMTASEWAALLRSTVDTLDARAKRLPLERIFGK